MRGEGVPVREEKVYLHEGSGAFTAKGRQRGRRWCLGVRVSPRGGSRAKGNAGFDKRRSAVVDVGDWLRALGVPRKPRAVEEAAVAVLGPDVSRETRVLGCGERRAAGVGVRAELVARARVMRGHGRERVAGYSRRTGNGSRGTAAARATGPGEQPPHEQRVAGYSCTGRGGTVGRRVTPGRSEQRASVGTSMMPDPPATRACLPFQSSQKNPMRGSPPSASARRCSGPRQSGKPPSTHVSARRSFSRTRSRRARGWLSGSAIWNSSSSRGVRSIPASPAGPSGSAAGSCRAAFTSAYRPSRTGDGGVNLGRPCRGGAFVVWRGRWG
jgi:hypothetical protein